MAMKVNFQTLSLSVTTMIDYVGDLPVPEESCWRLVGPESSPSTRGTLESAVSDPRSEGREV